MNTASLQAVILTGCDERHATRARERMDGEAGEMIVDFCQQITKPAILTSCLHHDHQNRH